MEFEPRFLTIVDLFEASVAKFASRELFGAKEDGTWRWLTYSEVSRQVDAFRAALVDLGVKRGDRIAVISNNRVKWAVGSFASMGLGAVYVPMYESQLDKDWEFILKDCEANVLIVANDAIYQKVKDYPSKIESLRNVVVMNADKSEDYSFDALLEKGKDKKVASLKPDKHDIAFLIYTSGTTGNPKGVRLSHENIASNVSAVHEFFDIVQEDRTLSFLPWAHSFGLTCELHMILSMGGSMALNTSVDQLVAEMVEAKPTVLVAVPRIFNRIYDNVQKQMNAKPAPVQKLFRAGLRLSAEKRAGKSLSFFDGVTYALANKIVFSKIRQKFGGRLRYAISGGAALSKDVAQFIDSLGISVYEGYGLTETSPIATANHPGKQRIGSVGQVIPGSKVVIDHEATGDAVHGEIVVYGPNIMKGYHNRPEENAAVMMDDGGFRTGDMGFIDDDGYLFITGRIKEQYKLENGKYVVPVPLEEAVKLSMLVTSVFVHGANKPYNTALIVPDFEALKDWASKAGIDATDPEALVKNAKVLEKFRSEIDAASKGFKGYERVERFALITEDFSVANGMLTPSLKLKRRAVLAKYGDLVESFYRK